MAKTAPRSWNKTFGIDPQIPIANDDRKAVEEKFTIDERNRHPIEIPRTVQLRMSWPMAVIGIGGIIAVGVFQLPICTMLIVGALAVVALYHGSMQTVRSHIGPLYRRELRARGYDICIQCGYWLRGLGDDVTNCPECGTARESSS